LWAGLWVGEFCFAAAKKRERRSRCSNAAQSFARAKPHEQVRKPI
jgi:hypothetical protein